MDNRRCIWLTREKAEVFGLGDVWDAAPANPVERIAEALVTAIGLNPDAAKFTAHDVADALGWEATA